MISKTYKQSGTDELTRRFIPPKSIVWKSGGDAQPKHSQQLLLDLPHQASTQDTPGCRLTYAKSPSGFLLDFGCELNGGIRITVNETSHSKPVRLRIRFGESVSEAMGTPDNDHAIHDAIVYVPCLGTMEFGNTGFRFVRIDLVDPGTFLEIKQICAVFVFRDIDYKGCFECSDDRLNSIWKTGAYTVHLNMQDYLWDGIKRDRLVWLGDIHPEIMTISYAFGFNDVVPKSLDFARDKAPLPRWMNSISSYSLWWILIQRDWYLYQADMAYLNEQRKYLLGLIEQLLSYIDENNHERLPEMRFLDWPTSEDKDALDGGLQALMILAFRAAACLCGHLQEFSAEQKCLQASARLQKCQYAQTLRKQSVAMMTLAQMLDAEDANHSIFRQNPCSGLSPFFGYYVLQARALAEDYEGALDCIRDYWGAMIDLGATTFWEDFDIAWKDSARIDQLVPEGKKDFHRDYGDYCYKGLRHSLCHGWSSGPTAWLSEHILGVRPLEPGSKKLLIKPNLAGLDWVRGDFPTPHGVVHISHSRRKNGEIATCIEKPDEIDIVEHKLTQRSPIEVT